MVVVVGGGQGRGGMMMKEAEQQETYQGTQERPQEISKAEEQEAGADEKLLNRSEAQERSETEREGSEARGGGERKRMKKEISDSDEKFEGRI